MIQPKELFIHCLGYDVAADLYESSTEEIVLMLIGYTSNKAKYVNFAQTIVTETDRTVLVFDYSGHGDSPFDIEDVSPAQNFLEVIAVYDWLKEKYPSSKISVIGTSYGGFMAARLVRYREVKQLVLRVPALYEPDNFYTKWRDSDAEKRHEYRLHAPDLDKHPLFRLASKLTGKALVVLHGNDDVCPPHSTEPFIRVFSADSWTEPNLEHGFGESTITEAEEMAYFKRITDWLKK